MSAASGRPVPPHGSGINYRTDPDETAGRALYRQLAERQSRMDTGLIRTVRIAPAPSDRQNGEGR